MKRNTRKLHIGVSALALAAVSATAAVEGMPELQKYMFGNEAAALVVGKPATKSGQVRRIASDELPGGVQRLTPGAQTPMYAPVPADAQLPERMPNLIGGAAYTEYTPGRMSVKGMYLLPTNPDEDFVLVKEGPNPTGGGVEKDGIYYCVREVIDAELSYVSREMYDTQTWENLMFEKDGNPGIVATDLALDPTTGIVYGCFNNDFGDGFVFGTIDYSNGWTRTAIADCGLWNGFAIDSRGNAYAIDMLGNLLSVDKETGATSVIGSTGLEPYYQASAAIDPATDRMYWSYCGKGETKGGSTFQYGGATGALYEVNLHTGEATMLTPYTKNQEMLGLYVPSAPAEADAPAAPEGLEFEFSDTMGGELRFRTPSTLYNGEAGSGPLTWTVTDNLDEVASGTALWDSEVGADIVFAAAGQHTLVVRLEARGGKSPSRMITLYAGDDKPAQTTATARLEDGVVTIEWEAVNATVNNGYLDDTKRTYLVKRFPDEVIVASGLQQLSLTDVLPDTPEVHRYYYEVWVKGETSYSVPALTNAVYNGALQPPYTDTMKDYKTSYEYTVIDANGDLNWIWRYKYGGPWEMQSSGFVASDDWLVTSPVRMERGNVYRGVFKMYESQGGECLPEVEVRMGLGAGAEDMTVQLMAVTEVDGARPKAYEFFAKPAEDGDYFIGLHCVSKVDAGNLYLSGFTIEPGLNPGAPGMVDNLQVVPVSNGSKTAAVSFALPSLNMADGTLEGTLGATVTRNGEEIKVVSDMQPGETVRFEDNVDKAGEYTYRVTTFNDKGQGRYAEQVVFMGINIPAVPQSVALTEIGDSGKVHGEWQPVTTDVNGDALPEGAVRYNVLASDGLSLREVVLEYDGTSVDFDAVSPSVQDMVQLIVFAYTEGGKNATPGYSEMLCAGKPYTLPFADSMSGGHPWSLVGMSESDGMTGWYCVDDETFSDVKSYDSDGGMLMMRGTMEGGTASIFFGKIDLSGVDNPALSMQCYNMRSTYRDVNTVEVHVRPVGETQWSSRGVVTMDEFDTPGWNKYVCPLRDYQGQTVQFRLTGVINKYATLFVDDVRVDDYPEVNLSLKQTRLPWVVEAGMPTRVENLVENKGSRMVAASEWSVELVAEGQTVASRPGKDIEVGQYAGVEFDYVPDRLTPDVTDVTLRVVCAADEVSADDECELPVFVHYPMVVAPQSLEGVREGTATQLSWSAPDLTQAAPDDSLQDFEDVAPWTMESFGDWILYDGDGEVIGGIQGYDLPGIPDMGEGPCGFFVMDSGFDWGQYQGLFLAYSGHNYLSNMYNRSGQADDWIISPELYGGAQIISWMAKSFSIYYPEGIEVLWSEGGVDPDDFHSLGGYYCSGEWERYVMALPEGARRFALRCVTPGGYMAFVDDIKYIGCGSPRELSLLGYNVWRNGEVVATVGADTTHYSDVESPSDARYYVTALYAQGESRGSNVVTARGSGIDDCDVATRVAGLRGGVLVEGYEGSEAVMCAIDGRVVASALCGQVHVIPALPGIYTVTVGGCTHKVVVR